MCRSNFYKVRYLIFFFFFKSQTCFSPAENWITRLTLVKDLSIPSDLHSKAQGSDKTPALCLLDQASAFLLVFSVHCMWHMLLINSWLKVPRQTRFSSLVNSNVTQCSRISLWGTYKFFVFFHIKMLNETTNFLLTKCDSLKVNLKCKYE